MRKMTFWAAAAVMLGVPALAGDANPPPLKSVCDVASQDFIAEAGGPGERVRVLFSKEEDGGVSFSIPFELRESAGDFPIGDLNDSRPHLKNQAQAVTYAKTLGAWAVLRADGRMKVFYASPKGCVEAFGN